MNQFSSFRKRGFTLVETVIAIGVLAVLLTGFMIVFAPAAAGIRRAISIQEADRLKTTAEQELVTLRNGNNFDSGFNKAFDWIKESHTAGDALLVYQYRADLASVRTDGTGNPVPDVSDKLAGVNYAVKSMMRRKSDPEFLKDLPAVEGRVYLVKCTQLAFDGAGTLTLATPGEIRDPQNGGAPADNADNYPSAAIAFAADFYAIPSKSPSYFNAKFNEFFQSPGRPIFSRNMAVRR